MLILFAVVKREAATDLNRELAKHRCKVAGDDPVKVLGVVLHYFFTPHPLGCVEVAQGENRVFKTKSSAR